MRRYLFSDTEQATSSHSDGERVLRQNFLDEFTKPPSRKRSGEDSELEVDEPRRWVDPTPISFANDKARAQAKDHSPPYMKPTPDGKSGPPPIDPSLLIPCGKVNIGGKAPHNHGLYSRNTFASQHGMAPTSSSHDFSDESVIPSTEEGEIRKPHVHFPPMYDWDSDALAYQRQPLVKMTDDEVSPGQAISMRNGNLYGRDPMTFLKRSTTSPSIRVKDSCNKEATARMRRKLQMQRKQSKDRSYGLLDHFEMNSPQVQKKTTALQSSRVLRSQARAGTRI